MAAGLTDVAPVMTQIDRGQTPDGPWTASMTGESPRSADLVDLFAASMLDVERSAPNKLLFSLVADDVVEATARELVRAHDDPFTFDVRRDDGELVLEVEVPASRTDLLDDLVVRAARARSSVPLLMCPC
jgi:hypothetical protein